MKTSAHSRDLEKYKTNLLLDCNVNILFVFFIKSNVIIFHIINSIMWLIIKFIYYFVDKQDF